MRRVEALGGLLKRIGNFDPESFINSFEARLIFQKTIYLLQAFGLYLGYRFSWYLRGPYSPDLARDGFELVAIYEETPLVRFKRLEAEKRFLQFLAFLGDKKNDAKWLETLASIHFLKRVYPPLTKNEIFEKIREKQPYIDREYFEKAWEHLRKHGLISSEG